MCSSVVCLCAVCALLCDGVWFVGFVVCVCVYSVCVLLSLFSMFVRCDCELLCDVVWFAVLLLFFGVLVWLSVVRLFRYMLV